MSTYDSQLKAQFLHGSLEDLARGVRDVLWAWPHVFDEGETVVVHVGGPKRESREKPLELVLWQDWRSAMLQVPRALLRRLETVRAANMPEEQYASWSCDCEEYCDQDHGEGRLELTVRKPTFHEMAAALKASR